MIAALSILACTLAMTNSWFIAKGRLRIDYRVGIVNATVLILVNVLLAAEWHPGVLALVVPSAFGIGTSIYGLRRLAREERRSI